MGSLVAWRQLRRLLREQAVDILNTHSSLDSWIGALAWRSLKNRPHLVRTRISPPGCTTISRLAGYTGPPGP